VPGPSSPRQVTDDFSKLKTPAQTAISTFWTYVEPWLRPIREEDVGLLEWDGDEETPFVIPPLGCHYTQVWEDEDNGYYPPAAGPSEPAPTTAPLPRWDPLTLQESDLISHEKGHTLGPIHERLVSALLPVPLLADGKPAAGGNVKPSANGESKMINPTLVDERIGKMRPFEGDKQPPKVNVQDMQDRLVKELRTIGLLGDEDVSSLHIRGMT
jgi:transcriptional adapter 3